MHKLIKSKSRAAIVLGIFFAVIISVIFCSNSSVFADTFTDIQKNWARSHIQKAIEWGYVSGYPDSTFRPDNNVTRAEFVTMVNAAFGVPLNGTGSNFTDVKNGDWFAQNVWSAVNAGYVDGYLDNTFKPYQFITREEATSLLVGLTKISGNGQKDFLDDSQIAKWARQAVNALATAGIISGYPDGSFGPQNNLTRAEAVVIINNTKNYIPSTPVDISLTVTGSLVNIRSGPGTSYKVVGQVKQGNTLKTLEKSENDWYKVQFGNLTGWIIGLYVKETDQSSGDNNSNDPIKEPNPGDGSESGNETEPDKGTDTDGNENPDKNDENNPEDTDKPDEMPNPEDTGKLIVIDAGHGGYATGAVGQGGTKEKDINLSIALRVMSYLENNGYNVIMTRYDDQDVSLADRSIIANNAGADIFISIHCNAYNRTVGGTETLFTPIRNNPIYKQQDESKHLATLIQNELVEALELNNRGVREQNLYVCRETNAPAVLVEVAFIDNSDEEKLLNDPDFQDKVAEAIGRGAMEYFRGD